ncbi:hypothetical protein A2U01_0012251, partial [Trifolium medium]|nr:hypothetical protein [Trifolium medium]
SEGAGVEIEEQDSVNKEKTKREQRSEAMVET